MKEGREAVGTLSDDLFCMRGAGILLVVFIHVLGVDPAHGVRKLSSPERPDLRAMVEFIHSFNMAVMIIGSGVAVSAFGRVGCSLAEFARKKLNKLIVPMLIWAPVLFMAQELSQGAPWELQDWLTLLGHVPGAWFPPYSIFWFVHVLVGCTLLTWLFQRFAAPAFGRQAGLVSLGVAVLLHLAVKTWRARVGTEQGDYVELILYWNRFFTLGALIQPWLAPVRAFLARLSDWLLVLLSAGFFSLLVLVNTSVPAELYEERGVICGPLGFCMLLTLTVLLRTRSRNRGHFWTLAWDRLGFIGAHSMSFYLFHLYFVSGMRVALELGGPGAPLAMHLALGFLAGCAGPWLLLLAFRGLRPFHWIIGLSGGSPAPVVEARQERQAHGAL